MTRSATFVALSGVAALANIVSRAIFSAATSYEVAVLLAYFVGMAVAFVLNKGFVFEASERSVSVKPPGFRSSTLLPPFRSGL